MAFSPAPGFDYDEENLPDVSEMPAFVPGENALNDKEEYTLFVDTCRAALPLYPWRDDVGADKEIMERSIRALFPRIPTQRVDDIFKAMREDSFTEMIQAQCVTFMDGDAWEKDEYRDPAHFPSKDPFTQWQAATSTAASHRLHVNNRYVGVDQHRRARSEKIFNSILSGDAMTEKDADDDVPGCFGDRLVVQISDLSFKKSRLPEDSTTTASSLNDKLRISLSVEVDGDDTNQAEVDVRAQAKSVPSNPGSYEDNEMEMEGDVARFWSFSVPQEISLFVGSGFVNADRMCLVIRIFCPQQFGCFSFKQLGFIRIPLKCLYTEVAPLGGFLRQQRPDVGFHFIGKHFTDKASGFGVSAALELKCRNTSHHEPPYFFNPNEPSQQHAQQATFSETVREWKEEIWARQHHAALLRLTSMCNDLADAEFAIVDSYRDFYFLDPDLFEVAVCVARARTARMNSPEDRDEAVQIVQYLAKWGQNGFTHPRQSEYFEGSKGQIESRTIDTICAIESVVFDPTHAESVADVCCEILTYCGTPTGDLAKVITDTVQQQVEQQLLDAYNLVRAHKLVTRATTMLRTISTLVANVINALAFATQARGKRVLTIALRRAEVTLTCMSEPLENFVNETIRHVAIQDTDPLGETFLILCGLYERCVACADAIKQHRALQPAVESIVSVFDSFLPTWLALCQKRMQSFMKYTVKSTVWVPVSPRHMFNESPLVADNVVGDVVDFFIKCAEWAPRENVQGCLPSFCRVLGDMAMEFMRALAGKRIDQPDGFVAGLICGVSLKRFIALYQQRLDDDFLGPNGLITQVAPNDVQFAKSCEKILDENLEQAAVIYDGYIEGYLAIMLPRQALPSIAESPTNEVRQLFDQLQLLRVDWAAEAALLAAERADEDAQLAESESMAAAAAAPTQTDKKKKKAPKDSATADDAAAADDEPSMEAQLFAAERQQMYNKLTPLIVDSTATWFIDEALQADMSAEQLAIVLDVFQREWRNALSLCVPAESNDVVRSRCAQVLGICSRQTDTLCEELEKLMPPETNAARWLAQAIIARAKRGDQAAVLFTKKHRLR